MFDFAPDTALSLSVVVLCCLFFQDGADEAGLERYQLAKGMGREYVVKAGSMGSNIFWWYGDGSSYRRWGDEHPFPGVLQGRVLIPWKSRLNTHNKWLPRIQLMPTLICYFCYRVSFFCLVTLSRPKRLFDICTCQFYWFQPQICQFVPEGNFFSYAGWDLETWNFGWTTTSKVFQTRNSGTVKHKLDMTPNNLK